MGTDVVPPVTERGPEAGTAVLTVNGQAHALASSLALASWMPSASTLG